MSLTLFFFHFSRKTTCKCLTASVSALINVLMEKFINISHEPNFSVICRNIVELQWLEHLWDHANQFETGVVRASED